MTDNGLSDFNFQQAPLVEVSSNQDLKFLEELLENRLQSEFPQAGSLQVRCAIKDGTLIVFTQQPQSDVILDPEPTFASLHLTLQSLHPLVTKPVQLYLKLAGQQQPYATYSFTLLPPVSLQVKELAGLKTREDNSVSPAEKYETDKIWNETPQGLESDVARMTEADFDRMATLSSDLPTAVPVMQFSYGNESARSPEGDAAKALPRAKKFPMLTLVAFAAVALSACLSGVYLLTSACVIGECKPIQTAQQLGREASFSKKLAVSEQHLRVAQQHLAEATAALHKIPPWSPHYREAQQLLQNFSLPSANYEECISKAGKLSPFPIFSEKAQGIRYECLMEYAKKLAAEGKFKEAIAVATKVPQNSPLYPEVQERIQEWKEI